MGIRARLSSPQGFTLIEVMIILVVLAVVSMGAVVAFAPAREAPVTVAMMADVETFATLQAEHHHVRGSYAEPLDVLASGRMRLSPGVQVDSSAFSPSRVYLRVRHPASSQRCSVDLSEVSLRARNRVLCFGGSARDSVEPAAPMETGEVPLVDTTAASVPPVPPPTAIVLAPRVDEPADVVVPPGGALERVFSVANRSGSSRSYRVEFASSDPDLVGVPDVPAPITIAAGGESEVRFRSMMSAGAVVGEAAAITLSVEDLEEGALKATGTFAAMAAVRLAPALVTAPAPAVVKPESTVVLTWKIRSRSNVARTVELRAAADTASLVLVSAEGMGRVRLDAGEERLVVTRYRHVGSRTAGSVRSATLTVADVLAPEHQVEEKAIVTTALALAAPEIVQPADTAVVPGSRFSRSWRIRSRSNAPRSYALSASVEGVGIEEASVVGPPVVSIAEDGATEVKVALRMKSGVPAGQAARVRLTARDEAGKVEASGLATVVAAEAPARPVVIAPTAERGYVGDSARMNFVVRNGGNGSRRYTIRVSSSNPAVASVERVTEEVAIPAFGSVEVPVLVTFSGGAAPSLDAAVTLVADDAQASALTGSGSGRVSRVNRPPTIHLVGPAHEYAAGEAVPFVATVSDPDGDALEIAIEFGDGMSARGADVRHAYHAPGTYYVRSRVVDAFGMTAEAYVTVRVVAPTIGCMDPAASNYDPNANVAGDCTYGPTLVKTEEMVRYFVCDWERDFRQYQSIDTWGRMYDHWSDGTMSPAGDAYRISYEERDLGPVTAAPYNLPCDAYDDNWP
jgi:Tfp pilus assembly protein PilE